MGIHRKITGTITRAAATVTGSQTISGLGGTPIIILFSAVSDSDSSINSDGWDDSLTSTCRRSNSTTILATVSSTNSKDHSQSIHVQNSNGNGHSANIHSFTADGFILDWIKLGSGLALTIKYWALM